MRGQKLYNQLTKPMVAETKLPKGRSATLIEKRNECMVARYYYFSRFSKKAYEEVLNRLAEEFFLTTETIARIIQENTAQLMQHRKAETTIYFMKNKWTHLKWWM